VKKRYLVMIISIVILIIPLCSFLFPLIKNSNYKKELVSSVYDNTKIDNIIDINKDNNYYIVSTNDKVIVFDLNYEEVYSIESPLVKDSDFELVYKRNSLYYEEKERVDGKIIYKFYNVTDLEFVYETVVGGL